MFPPLPPDTPDEAAAGAALLACLPGAPVLALAGACINLAVCNHCQAAAMAGDTLLRWAALLAAVAPCVYFLLLPFGVVTAS